jgi:hypothetical protein
LFFSGVAQRFPALRFAFLEGGVAWAATLFSDIVGHYAKRNVDAVASYNHERVDRDKLERLIRDHGDSRINARIADLGEALWPFSDPGGSESVIDEFTDCGVANADDIARVFERSFYFGCEADDPSNAVAFESRRALRLNAIFSSDLGHWDVPDNAKVLCEAHELVEDGLLTPENFREFTFSNAATFYSATNAEFFVGTSVESAVAELRTGRRY